MQLITPHRPHLKGKKSNWRQSTTLQCVPMESKSSPEVTGLVVVVVVVVVDVGVEFDVLP